MKKLRALFCPLLAACALGALALLSVHVYAIPHFDFLWDALLGVALGGGLSLLPSLCGFAPRRNALTANLWLCVFVLLVLLCCQYLSLALNARLALLSVLENPSTRLRVAEGALFGYCAFVAGRGKA